MLTDNDQLVIAMLIENWAWEIQDLGVTGNIRAGGDLFTRMISTVRSLRRNLPELDFPMEDEQ